MADLSVKEKIMRDKNNTGYTINTHKMYIQYIRQFADDNERNKSIHLSPMSYMEWMMYVYPHLQDRDLVVEVA